MKAWIAEASELRFGVSMPSTDAGPDVVMKSLADVRRRLDRVESLTQSAGRLRARTKRLYDTAQAELDDRLDEVIRRGGGAFRDVAFRERQAHYSLETMGETRAAREAAKNLSLAEEAVEVLRSCQRGLDSLRYDHHVLLRAFSVELSVDRYGYTQA